MAAGSQHRCVFVGNIPYDATEEQLIQICEEVGPVVSFRLVIDRETGKPKGYGFCEYKDEETALSARRNLQGYEINGRQLRVDFAENDKNADRNREQGRGGPGLATNTDASKHLSGPPIASEPVMHQPMGFQVAATAASVMAGALGGAQIASVHNRVQGHPGGGNDPLSVYLSRFSRHQLHEILSEMKALTTQNKALALQLLQRSRQLPTALFQVLLMLGLVTPQMMQIASQQPSSSSLQLLSNSGHAILQKQAFVGVPHRPALNQVPAVLQNPGILHQSSQHVHGQPSYQHPQLLHGQGLQMTLVGNSETATLPPALFQSLPLQPAPIPVSRGLISQNQPTFLQQPPASTSSANLLYQPQPDIPGATLQQPHPHISQTANGLPLTKSETLPKEVPTSSMIQDSTWHSRINSQDLAAASAGPRGTQLVSHPSKFRRLEDGSRALQIEKSGSAADNLSLQTFGAGAASGGQMVAPDPVQQPEKHIPHITPEVESALVQQVLSLTSEQLSSLTAEQREQVLQLQKMLSGSK